MESVRWSHSGYWVSRALWTSGVVVLMGAVGCQGAASVRQEKGPRVARVAAVATSKKSTPLVHEYRWGRPSHVVTVSAKARRKDQGGGGAVSSGCLSMQPIRREMRRLHPDFVQCIVRAQARLCRRSAQDIAALVGRYKIRLFFVIDVQGQVASVRVQADRPGEVALLRCLAQATAVGQFPPLPPRSGFVQVAYPVHAVLGRPRMAICTP